MAEVEGRMPKHNNALSQVRRAVRPGEGATVDLHFEPSASVSGQSLTKFTADISSVPVPAKRYSADVAHVEYSRETVKLLFGQEKYGAPGQLRTLLIIKMTPSAVATYLETTAAAEPKFEAVAEKIGYVAEQLTPFGEEPKETVSFDANFVFSAVSGREGCSDFYHSSPFAMASVGTSRKLTLDPVVRIDMRASLLLGIVNALRDLVSTLPPEILGKRHEQSV